MSKRPFSSKLKVAVYIVMAFILSIILFFLSISVVLEASLFNSEFIIDNMNSSNYFSDKKDEITQSLTDLGYASGLDESFFSGFIDEVSLHNDTETYINNYYSGKSNAVDVTNFKQKFNNALDSYISKNKIDNVNAQNREYLVKKASDIYRESLEIPTFAKISSYIVKLKTIMPFLIGGLLIAGAALCFIIIKTNYWKHRAVKYLYYATASAFLSVGIIPVLVLISGKIKLANFSSRALYNLFVQCSNNLLVALAFCSVLFLLISAALFFMYRKLKIKAET